MGRLDLNGKWDLRWADGQRGGANNYAAEEGHSFKALEAIVPGEVHLDLIRAGMIKEPTLYMNVLDCRWVEECIWTYKKVFYVPEEAVTAHAWINFEGLDYNARILLNSEQIGAHANFFLPCRLNVTGKLKAGENTLVVQLESGLYSVAEKPIRDYYSTSDDTILTKRMWLRKPQSSFGWDWSPRLLNVGIYKQVYLEWEEDVRLDQLVLHAELNDDCTLGKIKLRQYAEVVNKQEGELIVSIAESEESYTFPVTLEKGAQCLEQEITVRAPKLWWPADQGEQQLYTIQVKLMAGNKFIGETTKKAGFRKVVINQEPHPSGGNYFIVLINDRKIFIKGANLVPGDIIFARLGKEYYETVVDRALEANFNLLRVWGGGIYESDEFYELCDEKGILVWQEFIFACGDYPTAGSDMLQNIEREVTYQIRRLSSHTSLIVWCGNNENEILTYERREGLVYSDYALYNLVIPRILKKEDPDRYYQATSPYSPDHEHPGRNDMGDQHAWNIGFDNVNFFEYRDMVCRFPNEGGILGPNSLRGVNACLPEGQRYWNSFAWQNHDNSIEQWYRYSAPDKLMSYWLGIEPKDLTIEDFVYYGGLLQGEGLSEFINNFRRRKYDCAAAIFWMYNDCWPAVRSWTIVDYYLNRTPSFYPVRRAFAPISIVLIREKDLIKVIGVNDTPETFAGQLRYGLFTLAGEYVLDQSIESQLLPNTSAELASFDAKLWEEKGFDKAVPYAMLTQGDRLIARGRLFDKRFYELSWEKPEIKMERQGREIVFTSSCFAWGVCLDLEGEASLPDNFFDLWPGIPYKLVWEEEKEIPAILKIGNLIERKSTE